MGKCQTININSSLKKLIPILMDDTEGFMTSMGEVTADVVGTARELESEVGPV